MTLQEFNEISKIELKDEVVFDKVNMTYMESKSNKYDFIEDLLIFFKEWIWKNFDYLSQKMTKEQLFNHFVIYELDYYSL